MHVVVCAAVYNTQPTSNHRPVCEHQWNAFAFVTIFINMKDVDSFLASDIYAAQLVIQYRASSIVFDMGLPYRWLVACILLSI